MESSQTHRPPWPATIAVLLAYAALAISSGSSLALLCLSLGILGSFVFTNRYENTGLTKWTLRIIIIGSVVLSFLLSARKDESAFLDMRYGYSFALAAASEIVLQYWRREPTGGARAPLIVLLSSLVFLAGCTTFDDAHHYLWYLAPAYFCFLMLALPSFRTQSTIPIRLLVIPVLVALLLGGATHAGFLIYRGDLNALGSRLLSGQNVSASIGMSGRPILGSSFTLRDSLTRVLRIRNLGNDPYLRGMVFDSYTEREWGPGLEQRTFHPYRDGEAAAIRVERLDDTNGLLFLPLHTQSVQAEGSHHLEWAGQADGPLRTIVTDTDPLRYTINSGQGDAPCGVFDAAPTPEERARDLRIPGEIDPRVMAIAKEIGVGLRTPQKKIEAVVGFLHGNNQYSLTVDPGPGEPISNFILEHKSAHCEYFASAAVVLLRALNVPTRYVSGYYAHEYEEKGETLIRQRDAHAWAESWIDGRGWVTVDATPGNGRPDALAKPIPLWWRGWEHLQDGLSWIRNWVISSSAAQKTFVFSLLILGLLVPQVYRYWRRRRQVTAEFHYSDREAALSALAVRFERLLASSGQPCPEGVTWLEHLARVEEFLEFRAEPLEAFVKEYNYSRFGAFPDPSKIAALSNMLRTLEETSPRRQTTIMKETV